MDSLIKLGFYILYVMIIFLSVASIISSIKGFKKIKNLDSYFRTKYIVNSIFHLLMGIIVLLLAILFIPLLFLSSSFLEGLTVVSTLFGVFYFVLASCTPIILIICFPCLLVTGITLNKINKIELKEKNLMIDIENVCSVFLTCILLVLIIFAFFEVY